MNKQHLSFIDISKYLEKDLAKDTYAQFEKHISSCDVCKRNYLNAKNMLGMLSGFKAEKVAVSEKFLSSTMKKYHRRKNRNNIRHMFWPVSAAAIFIFLMFSGLLDLELNKKNTNNYAVKHSGQSVKYDDVFREYTLTGVNPREVKKFIRKHNGKVLISDNKSIIVEAKVSDYQRMRYGSAISEENTDFKYNANLLTVGSNGNRLRPHVRRVRKERTIKFRINLK